MAPATATATELQQQQPQKEHRSSVRQESKAKNDKTWLETILNEQKAQKSWERKWGPINGLQKKWEETKDSPLPRQKIKKEKEFKPKVEIYVEPSPPFPTTSSAMVGLRCSKDFWIENFGPLYLSPRLTIDPPKPQSPVTSDEEDEEEGSTRDLNIDPRRSGLYTTSRIFLK